MLKRFFMILVGLVVLSFSAHADTYFTIGAGGGGEPKAASISLDGGVVKEGLYRNSIMALGISVIFSGDTDADDALDYPVPHGSYVNLGTKQRDDEYAFYMKYGIEIFEKSNIYIAGLLGFSGYEEIELARSTATGWYYTQSKKEKIQGIGGASLIYLSTDRKLSFQVEGDNRRGVSAGVGFMF